MIFLFNKAMKVDRFFILAILVGLALFLLFWVIKPSQSESLIVYYDKEALFPVKVSPIIICSNYFDYIKDSVYINDQATITRFKKFRDKYLNMRKKTKDSREKDEIVFACILQTNECNDTLFLDGFPRYGVVDTLEYVLIYNNKSYFCDSLCSFVDNVLIYNNKEYRRLRKKQEYDYRFIRRVGGIPGDFR